MDLYVVPPQAERLLPHQQHLLPVDVVLPPPADHCVHPDARLVV